MIPDFAKLGYQLMAFSRLAVTEKSVEGLEAVREKALEMESNNPMLF
jgi:hypothetical protein